MNTIRLFTPAPLRLLSAAARRIACLYWNHRARSADRDAADYERGYGYSHYGQLQAATYRAMAGVYRVRALTARNH